ncbi:DnaJ -like protein subfamily C member 3 [Trichinella pseudospiralis]|uniref:DnaJ-like protein subfamily C member 3 n=1 Tax=Trichinella pseudospiralis TaxID=6337 RepID=A0A0V0Y777_TRIPS|nr:DnaJ -like protein subfamily C member 3 [Trichinella pseudospiralis]
MDPRDSVLSSLWALFLTYITVVNFFICLGGTVDGSTQEIERHLDLGKQLVSKGQFNDALVHYHAAVGTEADPNNYLTLYRRATVYLALGKSKSALPDLDRVIELQPDFIAARIQRGNVLLKKGSLDEAERDYLAVLDKDNKANEEVQQKLNEVESTRKRLKQAEALFLSGDYSSAEKIYTQLLEISPWNNQIHLQRAECYEHIGELQKAVMDIRLAVKLVPDNTDALYKASVFCYKLGDLSDSLNQIRECLKIDPEHQKCFKFYKNVKNIAKQLETVEKAVAEKQWQKCLDSSDAMLKLEKSEQNVVLLAKSSKCKCFIKLEKSDDAVETCSEVLRANPDDLQALLNRAEAYMMNQAYDEAIVDYQRAVNIDDGNRVAKEGLKKAQRMQKQSNKKDYYKILGVKRNADKRTISKAYRKLAQKWHPDNFQGDEKKIAEAKFIDIAAAKEVLTDPEKREKFDAGIDPLDPSAQSMPNQFYHFHGFDDVFGENGPFGDGGGHYTFKFHFN